MASWEKDVTQFHPWQPPLGPEASSVQDWSPPIWCPGEAHSPVPFGREKMQIKIIALHHYPECPQRPQLYSKTAGSISVKRGAWYNPLGINVSDNECLFFWAAPGSLTLSLQCQPLTIYPPRLHLMGGLRDRPQPAAVQRWPG